MNCKRLMTIFLLALAATLLSVPAFADAVTITLAHPYQPTVWGNTATFVATVAAPSTNSAPIYLNGDSFNVDTPLTVDDSGFFGFPLYLNPGASYTGVLFTAFVPLSTPQGNYYGYFQILGGSDSSQLNSISNVATFQIFATPEPGSLMLLGTGGMALFGVLRRKLS